MEDDAIAEMTDALEDLRSATEKLEKVDEVSSRLDKLEARMSRSNASGTASRRPHMSDGEARSPLAADEKREAAETFRQALAGEIELREMSVGSNPDGGYSVPLQIDAVIDSQLIDISPVRSVASVVRTETSNYRKLVNRRGATSGWSGETDTRTPTDTPQFEAIEPPTGELFAYPSVSNWVLGDSQFNLEAFLEENVSTEFAFQEGSAFIMGDGTNKPKGFLTYPTAATEDGTRAFGTLQEMVAASASVPTGDELIDLLYSLRPSYRQGAGVAWVMNSTTSSVIRKLKDGDGNYLWAAGLQPGQPASLLGYPVVEAEDMPDLAADAHAIGFGNWRRGYLVTDRTQTMMIRDNITTPGLTKFYFSRRVGGAVTDSNAIKLLKMAAS